MQIRSAPAAVGLAVTPKPNRTARLLYRPTRCIVAGIVAAQKDSGQLSLLNQCLEHCRTLVEPRSRRPTAEAGTARSRRAPSPSNRAPSNLHRREMHSPIPLPPQPIRRAAFAHSRRRDMNRSFRRTSPPQISQIPTRRRCRKSPAQRAIQHRAGAKHCNADSLSRSIDAVTNETSPLQSQTAPIDWPQEQKNDPDVGLVYDLVRTGGPFPDAAELNGRSAELKTLCHQAASLSIEHDGTQGELCPAPPIRVHYLTMCAL